MEEMEWLKKKAGEFSENAKKKYEKVKKKYDELTEKATNAKLEDEFASDFREDEFVKHVLSGAIRFLQQEQKHVKTMLDDYTVLPWRSVHEYFELNIINKQGVFYVEFKINHSQYRLANIHRLSNVIRYGKDSNDAEPGLQIKLY